MVKHEFYCSKLVAGIESMESHSKTVAYYCVSNSKKPAIENMRKPFRSYSLVCFSVVRPNDFYFLLPRVTQWLILYECEQKRQRIFLFNDFIQYYNILCSVFWFRATLIHRVLSHHVRDQWFDWIKVHLVSAVVLLSRLALTFDTS